MKHKTYFVSDLHFGHASMISTSTKRPWTDLESMTRDLIANWNATVTNADTVYILGDLFWTHESAHEVLPHLKGRKILIRGNHDEGVTEQPEIAAPVRGGSRLPGAGSRRTNASSVTTLSSHTSSTTSVTHSCFTDTYTTPRTSGSHASAATSVLELNF